MDPLGFLLAILAGLLAFFLALSVIPSKSMLSEQLDVLRSPEPMNIREAKRPGVFGRVLTSERRVFLRAKLIEAGWYTDTPVKLMLRCVVGAGIGVVLALLIWRVLNFPPAWLVPIVAMLGACGGYSPFFLLNQAIEGRHTAIQKALPEFLDMVASTVQAGLALNAALAYAVDAAAGPLGDEIKEALSEIRLGRARSDALKAAGERANQPEFSNALRIMTQAEKLGANIAKLLTELADDARHRRLMMVEEMAAKLPVKMVFPMVFFMIPAIFTVIFGTILANYFAPKP
jgi:tight adherence protein C